jgi:beta-N-acetylhexosaminidase
MKYKNLIILLFFILFIKTNMFSQTMNTDIDKKIGQMILVGFRGLDVNDSSPIVRDIRKYQIGSIILFDYDVELKSPVRNIESAKQIKTLVDKLQKYSSTPLFVTIDQEGGKVNRLKEKFGFPPTVSAQYLGKTNNYDTTTKYALQCAKTLKSVGVNLDFAPCVDLNTNPDNPVIGKKERSFSENPKIVARHSEIFLNAFKRNKIFGTLKHFPGHGSSKDDSHLGFVDVSDTWTKEELLPYAELIKKGKCDFIMTAHIFNSKLDDKLPATLSKKVLTGILRDSLKFKGVIFSDDMQMKAIADHYGLETAIENAIIAGVDILTFANNVTYDENIVPKIVTIIKKMIEDKKITPERIDESYKRIMKMKKQLSK